MTFAIVRLPAKRYANTERNGAGSERVWQKKEGVDENGETLHTLPSSQLTNKTLCQQVAGSTE